MTRAVLLTCTALVAVLDGLSRACDRRVVAIVAWKIAFLRRRMEW